MNKTLEEFKAFALKGNVLDLAVAVVIGGAFGKIVTSFVSDILMPPIGIVLGGVNLAELRLVLKAAAEGSPAVYWTYGNFLQASVDFLIIAASVFTVVKFVNRVTPKHEQEKPAKEPAPEVRLLTEIRDVLKEKRVD